MIGTTVRQSIVKNTVLQTNYKQTEIKNELEEGAGGGGGGCEEQGFTSKEINEETTVRPPIFKNRVLPRIDGGTKVLETVSGGTIVSEADGINIELEISKLKNKSMNKKKETTTIQYGGVFVSSNNANINSGKANIKYSNNMGVGGGVENNEK